MPLAQSTGRARQNIQETWRTVSSISPIIVLVFTVYIYLRVEFYTKLGWTIEETLQEQSESDPYRRYVERKRFPIAFLAH